MSESVLDDTEPGKTGTRYSNLAVRLFWIGLGCFSFIYISYLLEDIVLRSGYIALIVMAVLIFMCLVGSAILAILAMVFSIIAKRRGEIARNQTLFLVLNIVAALVFVGHVFTVFIQIR